ncbi:chemotaxis response regulator protein-glutamate methylesterase [Methylocystis sp. WRRC1]|uniref:protein-glutamate methylesterase/protein-glutamine glutaminase n=1 Tax=unclassified Methylocystis TaxID=2625913 RepID=UPI0001F875A2|nr:MULTISPECIES: chemotaxis response regulator protein-glutamate methylesterase [unclassified Methylocystis]MCC3244854.1 chemotaxis response regulator protein-glutamate methylesterase [Methylocystis sp. WRRC1]
MKKCNVLIVDDSRTMRALIASSLSSDPGIEVVGEAGDPFEAREAMKQLNPDVVTLDIEMPRMNGLDFLARIMALRPTPVIIISSLTEKGAEATIRALEIGAVDVIVKPSARNANSLKDLASRVKEAAGVRVSARAPGHPVTAHKAHADENFRSDGRIVAIGSSMGGVEALCTVLASFPENCPPTVITQHMPAQFTQSFASRLDRICRPQVREAFHGAPLQSGQVFVAPGGLAHLEIGGTNRLECRLREGDLVSGHRPSIDAMFASVARVAGDRAVGVILTGMGRDGAQGLLTMRSAGAETLGQDEATSLVYGMPRAAFEAGAVGVQLPLGEIGRHILKATNMRNAREVCR